MRGAIVLRAVQDMLEELAQHFLGPYFPTLTRRACRCARRHARRRTPSPRRRRRYRDN